MAKTIPQYRQEKYNKYDSGEEGKLFYRHEKNLDLVNTVEEIVYILQEENPRENSEWKKILKSQANIFPERIKKNIKPKIDDIYERGVRTEGRDEYAFRHKVYKKIMYNNDPRKYLQEQYPLVTDTIAAELSENIVCFSHGGVPVFFLDNIDRDTLVKHGILRDTSGSYRGIGKRIAIFLRQKYSHEVNERYFMHEYQHYLFHNFLTREFDGKSLDYKIVDEICAICVDDSNAAFVDILERMESYMARFANVSCVDIEKMSVDNGVIKTSIRIENNGELVQDKKILNQVGIVVDKTFEYTKLLSLFLELSKNNSRLNIDRQKAIRLLSMTSPHYRKNLLVYYTTLAKHMKEKKISTPS